MTDHDEPQHRAHYQPDPDRVTVRDDDDEAGVFRVRMPIASTGEVRNENDEPLTRDELDGMAQQVADGTVGVFPSHGMSDLVDFGRYSPFEQLGYWDDPEIVAGRDDTDLLEADAVLMDPSTLDGDTGEMRQALSILKAQAERNIGLSSSIGWRDDESFPGDVDLMEASIVGIGADPRTTDQHATTAVARAALANRDDDVDPEELVEEFRAVVMGPDSDSEGDTARDSVTDDDTQSGDEPDDANDDQPEWVADFRDLLEDIHDAVREDDEDDDGPPDDDDEEDEDGDGEGDGDDGDDEQSGDHGDDEDEDEDGDGEGDDDDGGDADDEQSGDHGDDDDEDDDNEQSLTVDGEELTAADVRDMREQLADADVEPPADDRDGADASNDDTETAGQSDDGPDWRA